MSAPAIVLLHGQPDFSASLLPLRTALAGRLGSGVQILVPDRPGYGANPAEAGDFTANTRWLHELLERNAAPSVMIVGHSWGGGVGILAAADRPLDVAGLVLLASIGPGCLLPVDRLLAAPVLGELASLATFKLGRRAVQRRARSVVLARLSDAEARVAEPSRTAMQRRPVWRSFLTEQRALIAQQDELDEALVRIAVPTLVVSGTADRLIPAVTPQQLVKRISGAQPLRLAGAGHDLHLRRTAQVAEHIASFARAVLDLD